MFVKGLSLMSLLVTPFISLALSEDVYAQVDVPVTSDARVQVITQSDEALYFNVDTIYELPLAISSPVVVDGRTLPVGTLIQGRLEPTSGGLQYVASGIQAGEVSRPFSAISEVLTDVKDPRETSAEAIAGDAAIGAAGGAVIGAVVGDGVSLLEIIGGAATGVIVGNVTAQRVVIIEPHQPITLQVR